MSVESNKIYILKGKTPTSSTTTPIETEVRIEQHHEPYNNNFNQPGVQFAEENNKPVQQTFAESTDYILDQEPTHDYEEEEVSFYIIYRIV